MHMPRAPRSPQRSDVVQRSDVILGAVVTAGAVALLLLIPAIARFENEDELTAPGPGDWQWWLAVAAIVAQGVCVAWSSLAPRRALVAVAALMFAVSLVPLGDASGVLLVAVIAVSYTSTRRRSPGESWTPWILAVALLACGGTLVNLRIEQSVLLPVAAAVSQAVVAVGIPTAVAAAVAARAHMRSARENEALARAREMEARTEAALATERTAIARELHDIAAHHLSGIALMSAAISQQLDSDPAAAKAGLADVRAQTRTLLDELRGLVALLRQGDAVSTDIESLTGLESLVTDAADRGLDVKLDLSPVSAVKDLAQGIGPLGQFAAFRTVQEALANVARHAPGATCVVELRDLGDALEIVVANGPSSTPLAAGDHRSDGFGIRGMQERAALTRSKLSYGATDDGGWRVRLLIPREPAAQTVGMQPTGTQPTGTEGTP